MVDKGLGRHRPSLDGPTEPIEEDMKADTKGKLSPDSKASKGSGHQAGPSEEGPHTKVLFH